jgi:short subunit fatty acids transporter
MVGFAERWFPDAYVFVLVAVIVVAAGTLCTAARRSRSAAPSATVSGI